VRRLAVEAEAQLEHLPLALGQQAERPCERLVPHRQAGDLVGQGLRVVLDEVPELGLVVVADRLLERDWGL
jgi:hypothetical protein